MRILCIGECMLELSMQASGEYRRGFAGDTFNTAVYFARQDPADEVVYLTCVGNDEISADMLAEMQQQGLNTTFVQQRSDKTVGLYIIHTDQRGERSFSYWRSDSAARTLFSSNQPEDVLGSISPDLIYLSGISLAILPDSARNSLLAYLATQSVPVAFDPNFRPRLWRDRSAAQNACAAAAGLATYVLTTLEDDFSLWDVSTMDQAVFHWQSLTSAELVIKNGAHPVILVSSDKTETTIEVMPSSVESPIDTTGAGDAFNAVYLASRSKGVEPCDAAAAANRLCAQVVMHRGAILPRKG